MLRTIHLKADIPTSREVTVVLPQDVPTGPADLVVLVASASAGEHVTLGDLLRSGFVGSWSGRADIKDSVEFARALREKAWKRSP